MCSLQMYLGGILVRATTGPDYQTRCYKRTYLTMCSLQMYLGGILVRATTGPDYQTRCY